MIFWVDASSPRYDSHGFKTIIGRISRTKRVFDNIELKIVFVLLKVSKIYIIEAFPFFTLKQSQSIVVGKVGFLFIFQFILFQFVLDNLESPMPRFLAIYAISCLTKLIV